MARKLQIAILILIMVIGASIRTYGLGRVVAWHDEALTILHISGRTIGESLKQEQRSALQTPSTWKDLLSRYQAPGSSIDRVASAVLADQPEHPPLFYQLLYLWAKAIGYKLHLLRVVPVIFGILCLPAFYWFAMELFRSAPPSLLATAMLCFSPIHICYSQDLRDYSLFSLMLSLSCAAFLRAWRNNRFQDWGLYTVLSTAGICCTYLIILVLAGQLLYSTGAVTGKWFRDARFTRSTTTQWLVHLTSVSVTLTACSPLLLSVVSHLEAVRATVQWSERLCAPHVLASTLLIPPVLGWTFRPTYFIFRDTKVVELTNHLWMNIPLLLLVLYSIFHMLGSHRRQCYYLLSISSVFLLIFWGSDLIIGGQRSTGVRFLLPIPMFALLSVSLMLCQWWHANKSLRLLSALTVTVLLTCQVQATLFLLGCNEHGVGHCRLTNLAKSINRDKDAAVLADLEKYSLGFPHLLALAHHIEDKSRAVAYIDESVPEWVDQVGRAYVVYYTPDHRKKFSRFEVHPASPENMYCDCVLIESTQRSAEKAQLGPDRKPESTDTHGKWHEMVCWWLKVD